MFIVMVHSVMVRSIDPRVLILNIQRVLIQNAWWLEHLPRVNSFLIDRIRRMEAHGGLKPPWMMEPFYSQLGKGLTSGRAWSRPRSFHNASTAIVVYGSKRTTWCYRKCVVNLACHSESWMGCMSLYRSESMSINNSIGPFRNDHAITIDHRPCGSSGSKLSQQL